METFSFSYIKRKAIRQFTKNGAYDSVIAQLKNSKNINELKKVFAENHMWASHQNHPITFPDGEYFTYHNNGQVKEKYFMQNNSLNGKYVPFYENGKIQELCNLIDNCFHGRWVYFDKNGKLVFEHKYYKGQLVKLFHTVNT